MRDRLSPPTRARLRRTADRWLAPIGSIRGIARAQVVLTYDDGPDPSGTLQVLEALDEFGARAVFFQLVHRAERYPDIVRRVIAAGHEVGLHGFDHSRLTTMPPKAVALLLRDGRARLEGVTRQPVRWFRPAYGAQNVATYLATRRAGLDPVVWGATAEDWLDGSEEEVARRATDRLAPGDVVLMHDAFEVPPGDRTPPPTFDRGLVARRVLAELAARGLSTTTLGEVPRAELVRTAWFRP